MRDQENTNSSFCTLAECPENCRGEGPGQLEASVFPPPSLIFHHCIGRRAVWAPGGSGEPFRVESGAGKHPHFTKNIWNRFFLHSFLLDLLQLLLKVIGAGAGISVACF